MISAQATVAFDYLVQCDRAAIGSDPRIKSFMQTAAPDGDWLFNGPWDHSVAQSSCGYDIIEIHNLQSIIRLARGDHVADDLFRDYPALHQSKLLANYGFCVVKPSSSSSPSSSK